MGSDDLSDAACPPEYFELRGVAAGLAAGERDAAAQPVHDGQQFRLRG
ncbi:hypothetical protein [Nocardia thailandica]|uniref:Uncharacterized protein n=1 Tax=Nocardia thailandica TaxID=257275 RepID=A0ABW6PVU5_9NOCA